MISGKVIIVKNKIFQMDLNQNGYSFKRDIDQLLALRDIVLDAVDNYEKEYQKKFLDEAKDAPPYLEQ